MKNASLEKSHQLKPQITLNSIAQTNKFSRELHGYLPSFGLKKVSVKVTETFLVSKDCIILPRLPGGSSPINNSQYWELRVTAPCVLYMKELIACFKFLINVRYNLAS